MKKIHVALAVKDFDDSLREYTTRSGAVLHGGRNVRALED
jgi:hypothetical protein